jgi:hypothetical protein
MDYISSSLSFDTDVTMASSLSINSMSTACYQGQTHGHWGFLLTDKEYTEEIQHDIYVEKFIYPFLIADDLLGTKDSLPTRYVIDFQDSNILSVQHHNRLFKHLEDTVLIARQESRRQEQQRNAAALQENNKAKVTKDHANALEKWWRLFRSRPEMISHIERLPRYIVCARVTKRPIFEFIHPAIHPNDALMVFPMADDYSFGILQSEIHWIWFINRCSTLKGDPRYTSNTVFDTFPWPQDSSKADIDKIVTAARELRLSRRTLMTEHNLSLRDLYRSLEFPGKHPLKEAQHKLDRAVQASYHMPKSQDVLAFLLNLNQEVARKEQNGESVVGPGLPTWVENAEDYITDDCIRMS